MQTGGINPHLSHNGKIWQETNSLQ